MDETNSLLHSQKSSVRRQSSFRIQLISAIRYACIFDVRPKADKLPAYFVAPVHCRTMAVTQFRQHTLSDAIVSASLQLNLLVCRSSQNVDRQVSFRQPPFLSSAGVQPITHWALRSDGILVMCSANWNPLSATFSLSLDASLQSASILARTARCQLLLITNRKSHTGFRLVPTSMTLNVLERRNSPYFAFIHGIRQIFSFSVPM